MFKKARTQGLRNPSLEGLNENIATTTTSNGGGIDDELKHWRRWKLLSLIGFVNGVFPVTNLYGSRTVEDLEFSKLSFPYIFSLIITIIKCISMAHVLYFVEVMNGSFDYEQTMTDMLAFGMSALTSLMFGIFAHFFTFSTSKSFLALAKRYRALYRKVPSRFMKLDIESGHFIVNTFISTGTALTVPFIAWNNLRFGIAGNERFRPQSVFFFGLNLDTDRGLDLVLFLGYFVAVMAYLEVAVVYVYGQLIGLSEGTKSLLQNFIVEVKMKSEEQMVKSTNAFSLRPASITQCSMLSWAQLSELYLEFHQYFAQYEKHVSGKLIFLYLSLIIRTIVFSYFLVRSEHPIVKEFWYTQIYQIVATSYLLYVLANSGEVITRKYKQFIRELVEVSQNGKIRVDEKVEFNKYLTIVQSIPVFLNARGFFIVKRTNVISIFSVILTYIIVLLQFRQTDTIKYDSQGIRTIASQSITLI